VKNNIARKLAQIAYNVLLVGIDPHKKKHAVVIMTREAVVLSKFMIPNSREGFELLIKRVKAAIDKAQAEGAAFGIEAGGHSWRNLAYYLDDQGWFFRTIHPLTAKRHREGDDINRHKTDYRDATMAAELLRTGKFTEPILPQGSYAELRTLHASYQRLKDDRSAIINLVRALLDNLFPEFCQVFKDPFGKNARLVLSVLPRPQDIVGLTAQEFIARMRSACPGSRIAVKMLKELHEVAGSSITVKEGSGGAAQEIQMRIQQWHLLTAQIEDLERQLHQMVREFPETPYLLSLGLTEIMAAGLIANIGPLDNYGNYKALIKLAGTNPTRSESGGKRGERTPISKQGRSDLRRCLWVAAMRLLRVNPEFNAWAKRLKNRPAHANPLHHREALGAAMNKLLRLYFALVSKRQMYSPAGAAEAKAAA